MTGKPASGSKRNKVLTEKFFQFIDHHPPVRVSRHLRNILLDYISHQVETGLPLDFHVYLWELYDLFELLDMAADEQSKTIHKNNALQK
ncbi:MAG TPA: hypothetical protein VLJ68_00285 [Chitinophagaceae bacterium]|nr:hypothetical protein [Chitinophagaceae bacterium]